ncbi:segregation and condensation protein A [Marinicrinis sediminis]|uniref:Segregation and condensation protein A n=1 Tax=Marinicrinis sediminis TaxID=1652465 RepID=A0ABW5RDU4_9BACL
MAIHYKLEGFEGPLDLLLHLIDKAEVDIYDIPIVSITEQYLIYIRQLPQLELDPTSEFLVMAATLLQIKSKMLLPKPPVIDLGMDDYEEDIDPRTELVEKLIEYKKYKSIAEHLRDKELARSLVYSKEPLDLTPFLPEVEQNPVKGLHLADIVVAFQKALKKAAGRNTVTKIRKDEISVKDRIGEIMQVLVNQPEKRMLFSRLFEEDRTREDLVVSFLALLELMKMKKIRCFQHRLFEEIVIEFKQDGEEMNESAGNEIRD